MKIKLFEEINRIKGLMDVSEAVKHIYQPTGHSCGPTCIKMVGDFIKGDVPSIDDICMSCGTDWVVGTPPEKMKIGLDKLGIQYKEHISEKEPFQSIKNVIDRSNVAIVRTITKNIPHWIVIDDYNDKIFFVNDPWLGQIKYTEQELGEIWKIRDFFFYEIITGNQQIIEDINIRIMNENDVQFIYPTLADVFDLTGLSNDDIWSEIDRFDINLSIVAEINGEIGGFYFLKKKNIPSGGKNHEIFDGLTGVEGIALGVLKKYKNKGIGKRLIEYPQNLPGVDYVWGYQFKSLKNIDDWLKRRKIYYENNSFYITYQMLTKKGA